MRREKNQFCYFGREVGKAKVLAMFCEALIL